MSGGLRTGSWSVVRPILDSWARRTAAETSAHFRVIHDPKASQIVGDIAEAEADEPSRRLQLDLEVFATQIGALGRRSFERAMRLTVPEALAEITKVKMVLTHVRRYLREAGKG